MKHIRFGTPPRPHLGRAVAMLAIALLSLVPSLGCKGIELESHWRDSEIAVDGVNEEWGDYAVYFEDEGFIVGVLNDGEFLYVGLMASSQEVRRQVIMSGFTVWLDPQNDKKKQFGIRFPLGMRGMGMRDMSSPEAMREGDAEMQQRLEQLVAEMDEFEVLRPEKAERTRVSMADDMGIHVRLGHSRSILVYELKVPIGSDGLFTIDTQPGETIALGLESPEIDFGDMRESTRGKKGGGMQGGGRPPGGGGGGMRGGGGRPSGGDFEKPEPFDVWAKVRLASQDMSTQY